MLIQSLATGSGPGFLSLFYAACIWIAAMLVVLYHRAGIQVVGAVIACVGFVSMLVHNRFFLALTLFTFGLLIHSFGRLLFNLKRRQSK